MINPFSSLSKIVEYLQATYGDDWDQLEASTIVLELGTPTQLLVDKILLCQALKDDRDRFYDEVLFFLYSASIINDQELDITTVPAMTSAELAYAVCEVSKVFPLKEGFSFDVKMYITEILKDEGFSEPTWPFTFLDKEDFDEGQTREDTENKERGIKIYIAYMNKLGAIDDRITIAG